MKRMVFLFSAAFFAFGVDRAAAYDFKVCNFSVGPISYAHATMVSAGCHDVTLVDINSVTAVLPEGQCVGGWTGNCLIAEIELKGGGVKEGIQKWSNGHGQFRGTWNLEFGQLCKDLDIGDPPEDGQVGAIICDAD